MVTRPARTCDECRWDNGWHFADDDARTAYRCPNYQAAELAKQARELSAVANEKAAMLAKDLLTDFARGRYEFSANDCRELFDDNAIPDPVIGAVFAWAAGAKATPHGPLIESTGRMVPSTEATTRHRLTVWRSRIYRGRVAS